MEQQRWSYKKWLVVLMWDETVNGFYCHALHSNTAEYLVTDYRTEQLDAIAEIVSMINKG